MEYRLIIVFLMCCLAINTGLLVIWFGMFAIASDWIFKLHGRFFKNLSRESFEAIHYGGMAALKVTVVLFNLVPLLALMVALTLMR
jgi:hypothetical protein